MYREKRIDWSYVYDCHLLYWLYYDCEVDALLDALPSEFVDELRDWALALPETMEEQSRTIWLNCEPFPLERSLEIKNWFRRRAGQASS